MNKKKRFERNFSPFSKGKILIVIIKKDYFHMVKKFFYFSRRWVARGNRLAGMTNTGRGGEDYFGRNGITLELTALVVVTPLCSQRCPRLSHYLSEGRPQCKGKVVVGGDWYILYSVTWVRCGQQALITRRVRLRPLQRVLRVCVFRGAPNKPGEGGGGVGSRVVGWRGKNRNKKKRREKENGIQEEE